MLNDRIQSLPGLQSSLLKADEYLSNLAPETPFPEFAYRFQELGLGKGWGDNAQHVLEIPHLLLDILQASDPSTLETFLGRVQMIFNVVILFLHMDTLVKLMYLVYLTLWRAGDNITT